MPHRTVRNMRRKERGLSMLSRSIVSSSILTLTLSFVLSDLTLNLTLYKLKISIFYRAVGTNFKQ